MPFGDTLHSMEWQEQSGKSLSYIWSEFHPATCKKKSTLIKWVVALAECPWGVLWGHTGCDGRRREDVAMPTIVIVSDDWVDLCEARSWNLNKFYKSYPAAIGSGYVFAGGALWKHDLEGVAYP